MLVRIFTHSLKNLKCQSSLYIWLACVSRDWAKIGGGGMGGVGSAKASSNRRTGYWYSVPSRANFRKCLGCGAIWMWRYAHFNSTDTTSPQGESAPRSVPAISSRTDACRELCWWAWDLISGRVLHLSWAPQNIGCKSCSPACSLGLVLSLLFLAGCIALVLGSGHFEAMLETAPRRWNRVVCVWIEVPTLYYAE